MFVMPRFQLRLSLWFMVVGGLLLGIVGLFVSQKIGSVQELMNSDSSLNLQVQGQANQLMLECIQMAIVGFGLFVIFSFVFALVVGHRIAGPQMVIQQYIEALIEGNYDHERELRPSDELGGILQALKLLKAVLKERDTSVGSSVNKQEAVARIV
jgi:signal transduction histidine kinase